MGGAAEPGPGGRALPAADVPEQELADTQLGGDAPCFAPDVCDECGLLIEDRLADTCPRCGTPRG